jgi:uncharacterized protein YbjQ (UPF0145 family)
MKNVFLSLLIGASIFFVGCTQYQHTLIADEQSYPATSPEKIAVYFSSEKQSLAYKEIGAISCTQVAEATDIVNKLKQKAAEMGADAILNCEVQITLIPGPFSIPVTYYTASGVAVKYTKN